MTKAVILAAGWGKRMRPLTDKRPKPALKIFGKTLIEHNLDQLVGLIKEAIIVVGYEGKVIQESLGEDYKGIKIRYAPQKEQLGTGDAAKAALPFLDDQFLILNGDDLYRKEDLEKCLSHNPSILVKEVDDPTGFGQIVHKEGKVTNLVEKPKKPVSNLVNVGVYFINKSFFDQKIEKSERGEFEITDYIKLYLNEKSIGYQIAENWDPVSYPWNLIETMADIFDLLDEENKGEIEDSVLIKGKVIIKKGSVIKAGTRIEGPAYIGKNCQIGPGATIRGPVCIEDDCHIGHSVEIKNTMVGKGSKIPHLSYFGDSVIGEGCNIGGGTISANLLFNDETIKTVVKDKLFDTKRKKLGCIIGDFCKLGINCSIMPGAMIGSESIIYPGSLVKKNIKPKTIFKNHDE